jgi:hypothetical protein
MLSLGRTLGSQCPVNYGKMLVLLFLVSSDIKRMYDH